MVQKVQNYTARLENWYYDPFSKVYRGMIYDDVRKRWWEGANIHTSFCDQDDGKEGDVVTTLNSAYLLGKPGECE